MEVDKLYKQLEERQKVYDEEYGQLQEQKRVFKAQILKEFDEEKYRLLQKLDEDKTAQRLAAQETRNKLRRE